MNLQLFTHAQVVISKETHRPLELPLLSTNFRGLRNLEVLALDLMFYSLNVLHARTSSEKHFKDSKQSVLACDNLLNEALAF